LVARIISVHVIKIVVSPSLLDALPVTYMLAGPVSGVDLLKKPGSHIV
jgi:hypothetical protein